MRTRHKLKNEQMRAKSKRVLTQKHEQQIESEHTWAKNEQVEQMRGEK